MCMSVRTHGRVCACELACACMCVEECVPVFLCIHTRVSAPCVKLYVFMCAHTSTCLRACVVVCAHRDCTQACVCVTVRAGLCM